MAGGALLKHEQTSQQIQFAIWLVLHNTLEERHGTKPVCSTHTDHMLDLGPNFRSQLEELLELVGFQSEQHQWGHAHAYSGSAWCLMKQCDFSEPITLLEN